MPKVSEVIRPTPLSVKRVLALAPVLTIALFKVFAVLAVGRKHDHGLGWMAVPALGALVVPPLFILTWLVLRARVESLAVVDGAIVWRTWLGRQHRIRRRSSVHEYRVGFGSDPVVVFEGVAGERPFVLSGARWPTWFALLPPLGLEAEDEGKATPGEVRELHPGAKLPFSIGHPFVTGIGSLVIGILYIGLVINVFYRL